MMHEKLRDTLAAVDWRDRASVERLAVEQEYAFGVALERIQSLDPVEASNWSPALTAGLPQYARNVLMVLAQQRLEASWRDEAKQKSIEEWLQKETAWVAKNMARLLHYEYVQALRKQQIADSKAAYKLGVLSSWAETMTEKQAHFVGAAVIESSDIGVEFKRSWEKAALMNQMTQAVFSLARARAPRIAADLEAALSSDRLRSAVDGERTLSGGVSMSAVERLVVEAVSCVASMSDEQRMRCAAAASAAVRRYAEGHGIDGVLPSDAAAMTQHIAGLRAHIANAVLDEVLDAGIEMSAFEALTARIEAGIDGISVTGPGRLDAFAAVHADMAAGLRDNGTSVDDLTCAEAVADVGREALRDAARVVNGPALSSDADVVMMHGLGGVAEAVFEHVETMRLTPEQPAPTTVYRPMDDIFSAIRTNAQEHLARSDPRTWPQPETAHGYNQPRL